MFSIGDTDPGSNWKQLGSDIPGSSEGDYSGWSISLSGDGRSVLIGSPSNDDKAEDSGHVRVFSMDF